VRNQKWLHPFETFNVLHGIDIKHTVFNDIQ
jgi:hypothetical protein